MDFMLCTTPHMLDVRKCIYSYIHDLRFLSNSINFPTIFSDVISYIITSCSDALKLKNMYGVLPLHAVVVNKHPLNANSVKMIIDAYPEAAKIPDNDFSLPIHKAAKHATLDVIKLVHEAFIDGVKTADAEGLLPMHYVAEREKSRNDNLEVMQYLLSLNPEAVVLNNNSLDFDDSDGENSEDSYENDSIINSKRRKSKLSKVKIDSDSSNNDSFFSRFINKIKTELNKTDF